MVKVILDSNFYFVPFKFKIHIFEELDALFGKSEPIVLSTTIEELQWLMAKGSLKIRKQAQTAFGYTQKCRTVNVEKSSNESYDDIVLKTAKEWNYPVATNDANLRKRLREDSVTVVYVRKRSHLVVDGNFSQ
jgi:rRNA-processing protein FCF1